MILNLGAGQKLLPDAINHDILPLEGIDVCHDLNCYPWPWVADLFDTIYAIDLVEHLDDFFGFFNECWRIAKKDCLVKVEVPHAKSPIAWIDPTHKRGYYPQSFHYLDPTTQWGEKYSFYNVKPWKLANITTDGNNINVVLVKE